MYKHSHTCGDLMGWGSLRSCQDSAKMLPQSLIVLWSGSFCLPSRTHPDTNTFVEYLERNQSHQYNGVITENHQTGDHLAIWLCTHVHAYKKYFCVFCVCEDWWNASLIPLPYPHFPKVSTYPSQGLKLNLFLTNIEVQHTHTHTHTHTRMYTHPSHSYRQIFRWDPS